MKRCLALLLSLCLMLGLTACGGERLDGVEAPVDVLTAVWNTYAEDDKFFAMGGDYNTPVDGAPGTVDITQTDFLNVTLVCPAEAVAMIDGAASLMHVANPNAFTGAAYHLTDDADMDAFIAAVEEAVYNNQWLCGAPEKLCIAPLAQQYIVVAFGAADLIDTFQANLSSVYTTEAVITDVIR